MSICPGCGLVMQSNNSQIDTRHNASKDCLDLCYELSYYTLSLHDKDFIHQHVVDTYAAQHASQNAKPIIITFGLIGIYLSIVHGYSGKQVQNAHILLANTNKEWPRFILPAKKANITIRDVIEATEATRQDMIMQWMQSVWDIWQVEHVHIASLTAQYINV